MRNLSSNLKWVWLTHFLSHSPVTLENWISFWAVQMILVLFKIPHGDWLAKNDKSRCVQVIPRSTGYLVKNSNDFTKEVKIDGFACLYCYLALLKSRKNIEINKGSKFDQFGHKSWLSKASFRLSVRGGDLYF